MAGSVQGSKLEYLKIAGVKVMVGMATQIDIYESILSPGIIGEIHIADFQGLAELKKVFAGDDLEIGLSSEGKPAWNAKFKIFASHENIFQEEKTSLLTKYHFCSPWLIDGLTRQLSKPYTCKYIHDIIRDQLTECGADIGYIEPTKQILENYVTPLWTPVHNIRYLCSFALNRRGIGGYTFWTCLKTGKVNVTTIDYMTKGSFGTYKNFSAHVSNIYNEGRMSNINLETNFDIIKYVNSGVPYIKNMGFNWHGGGEVYTTTKDLVSSGFKPLSKKLPINSIYFDKKYAKQRFCSLFPKKTEDTSKTDFMDLIDGDQSYKYRMLSADLFKLTFATHGESTRFPGMLAQVLFPSINPDKKPEQNIMYSGKYLIRDIKHSLTNSLYHQYICLATDGYYTFSRTESKPWAKE